MADRGKRRAEIEEFEEPKLPEAEEQPTAIQEEEPGPTEVVEEARYFVDPQWYDRRGLAFNVVAQGRLCSSCAAKLGTFVEERYPVIDPKTKRVTFEYRRVPYASNPLPIIRDCCSRARDYITSETPLVEAIFRVYLANGNQPMTVAAVREHLLTYLPEMAALRSDYPPELLERLIRADRAYGLREHQVPVGA
ncbi:MAG: hypothetical protein M1380_11585 [Chloroflexi bacterium]|nr:hypothetical protein [Chloroflexota bacterium]